jgi:hypothetical protein
MKLKLLFFIFCLSLCTCHPSEENSSFPLPSDTSFVERKPQDLKAETRQAEKQSPLELLYPQDQEKEVPLLPRFSWKRTSSSDLPFMFQLKKGNTAVYLLNSLPSDTESYLLFEKGIGQGTPCLFDGSTQLEPDTLYVWELRSGTLFQSASFTTKKEDILLPSLDQQTPIEDYVLPSSLERLGENPLVGQWVEYQRGENSENRIKYAIVGQDEAGNYWYQEELHHGESSFCVQMLVEASSPHRVLKAYQDSQGILKEIPLSPSNLQDDFQEKKWVSQGTPVLVDVPAGRFFCEIQSRETAEQPLSKVLLYLSEEVPLGGVVQEVYETPPQTSKRIRLLLQKGSNAKPRSVLK